MRDYIEKCLKNCNSAELYGRWYRDRIAQAQGRLYNPRGLLRWTCCKDNIQLPGNYIINATSVAVPFQATGLSRDTPQNKDLVGCPVFIGLRAGRLESAGSNCPALSR